MDMKVFAGKDEDPIFITAFFAPYGYGRENPYRENFGAVIKTA